MTINLGGQYSQARTPALPTFLTQLLELLVGAVSFGAMFHS